MSAGYELLNTKPDGYGGIGWHFQGRGGRKRFRSRSRSARPGRKRFRFTLVCQSIKNKKNPQSKRELGRNAVSCH
jgi:hypothetical protein